MLLFVLFAFGVPAGDDSPRVEIRQWYRKFYQYIKCDMAFKDTALADVGKKGVASTPLIERGGIVREKGLLLVLPRHPISHSVQ